MLGTALNTEHPALSIYREANLAPRLDCVPPSLSHLRLYGSQGVAVLRSFPHALKGRRNNSYKQGHDRKYYQ